tara:strand:- start:5392 stop:5535 length:144 start_codon:yes stop_codon:yes gene_type:complete
MPTEIVITAAILAFSMTLLFIYHKLDDSRRWRALMEQADKDDDDELG